MNRPLRLLTHTLALTFIALANQGKAVVIPEPGLTHNPIVIKKGGTYTGNWVSLDPDVPAITIQTKEHVIIRDSVIRSRGYHIRGYATNLTVINNKGYALNPMKEGRFPERFISAEGVLSLEVRNNYIEGTSGVYVNGFDGDRNAKTTISIVGNRFLNVDGRYVNSSGHMTGERYLVQAIQLAKIYQVPGMEVAWNEIINEPGRSGVEENINVFQTSGTAISPILIHNNYIQGAYSVSPEKDVYYAGGGIMIGDGPQTPDVVGGHVRVYRNQIVNTSNQGIAVAGGHDQHVYENRVLSSGRLPDQSRIASSNVGIYMWDHDNGRRYNTFFNNTITNNLIGWVSAKANGSYNNLWLPNCTTSTSSKCSGNRVWPTGVSTNVEKAEFQVWLRKVAQNKQKIGPN